MIPNPLLRRLGLSDSDRVVIIHVDDVGMCQASVEAFKELNEIGIVTCGAVMVPCPWFPAAAEYARMNPGADIGVHLTLTSEWAQYRWGPVSTRDPKSGLIDEEGFFPRKSRDVQATADLEAVRVELEAQVERAKTFGIDITHVDTHMGSVAHGRFAQIYLGLAMRSRIPGMAPRKVEQELIHRGMAPEEAHQTEQMLLGLEAQGVPLVDLEIGLPLERPDHHLELAKTILAELPAGVTHFLCHPCIDTPELRAITPDWRGRVADYEAFRQDDLRETMRNLGIHAIGYRTIRDLIRNN